MATSKAQDPAAAALSAIEEALNLAGDGSAEAAQRVRKFRPRFSPKRPIRTRRRRSRSAGRILLRSATWSRKCRRRAPSSSAPLRACRRSNNTRFSRRRSRNGTGPWIWRKRPISPPSAVPSRPRFCRPMTTAIRSAPCCGRSIRGRAERRFILALDLFGLAGSPLRRFILPHIAPTFSAQGPIFTRPEARFMHWRVVGPVHLLFRNRRFWRGARRKCA